MTPNWIDWLVYRIFYWRWNRIFMQNDKLRSGFIRYWIFWERVAMPLERQTNLDEPLTQGD